MPAGRLPSRRWWISRGAQGPGRRDPLRDVRGARPLHGRAVGPGARRPPRHARQHGPPAPRAPPRGGSGRRRGRAPGHRRPAPAPLLPRARRAGLGFDPPAHALLAGLLAALAERVGPTPTTRPQTGHVWGADAGRRTRCRSCLDAPSRPSSTGSGSSPRSSRDGTDDGAARIEFLHCPFRELAEAYPELVCNLHRGLCEGVVGSGRRGKQSRSSRRCTTRSRAT